MESDKQRELRLRRDELSDRLVALGHPTSDSERAEWEQLRVDLREADRAVVEDRKRRQHLLSLFKNPNNVLPAVEPDPIRIDQPVDLRERQRDALRAIEREHRDGTTTERAAVMLDSLVRRDEFGTEARYLAAVADPAYKSAFARLLAGAVRSGHGGFEMAQAELSESERSALRRVSDAMHERAMAVGTGSSGGFAVPYQLDPSILLTSNGAVNPFRDFCRVETVTTNEWRGVSSAGVVANFRAEGAETTDDSPTLAQPTAFPERADVFIPFSVEIGMDWGALQAEMVRLISDAKDVLEADKYVTGLGHASNQPEGLNTSATAVVSTAAATTLAVGDIYSLKAALPVRYQPPARFVGNGVTFDRVRRLVGPGSAEPAVWNDAPESILRLPAHQASGMSGALTSGASILTVGDFSHFLIADRVGLSVELLPHLLGSNRRPTLQRGIVAYWRTTSKVLAWQAFRTLNVT